VTEYRDFASVARLTRGSTERRDHRLADPGELRTRASRYRLLAEALVDPRVIAVVEACAREFELEAISMESAENVWSIIQTDHEAGH
jgi:hypothetical protein